MSKISDYLSGPNPIKKVVFGGHWSNNPGWLCLTQADQDITKRLDFPDNSLDCVYSEHVLEHLDLSGALNFMKESFRVLKPDGIFRVICPTVEGLIHNTDNVKDLYVKNSLIPHFQNEHNALVDIGLSGIFDEPNAFLFNSMFLRHEHRFIWTEKLISLVLVKLGFQSVHRPEIGVGYNTEFCIERRQRGIYTGNDWSTNQNTSLNEAYDPESGIVEAMK